MSARNDDSPPAHLRRSSQVAVHAVDARLAGVYDLLQTREQPMLDTFIIDRIRRERERADRQSGRLPLRIERRPPPPPASEEEIRRDGPAEEKRGSVIIDFRL